jgi:hypothetical protein
MVTWSSRVKRCSVSMMRSHQREYCVEWTSRVTGTKLQMLWTPVAWASRLTMVEASTGSMAVTRGGVGGAVGGLGGGGRGVIPLSSATWSSRAVATSLASLAAVPTTAAWSWVTWAAVWRAGKASAGRVGASVEVGAPVGADSWAVASSCRATSSASAARR